MTLNLPDPGSDGPGRDIQAAVAMAVEDYKAGVTFSVTWQQDGCSGAGGAAAAKSVLALAPPPLAVIGHACPSAEQAAAPLYQQSGLIHINAGSLPTREPQTRRFGPRHFRLPADGLQGTLIASALIAAGLDARIAFVRDRTLLARTTLRPVGAALHVAGRKQPLLETFAGGEKDFATLAQRLKAAQVSHIVLAAFPSEAGLLVPELRKGLPGAEIFATDQLADPAFGVAAGPSADGIKVALAPDLLATPAARDVAARLEHQGAKASRTALAHYAAIQVLALATEQAAHQPSHDPARDPARDPGMDEAAAVAHLLATQEFATILGPVRFDANGAANVPSHVFYTWQNGKLLPPTP